MRAEPWIPFLAREYVERLALPRWRCFEWGSGGSTLWLERMCQRVTTVEHDEAWFWKVAAAGRKETGFMFMPPQPGSLGGDPANPAHYATASTKFKGQAVNFRRYASAIDLEGPFDFVLVDGRARASCLAHAVPEVAPGGWLALDNAERPWYTAPAALEGWERVRFWGHGPRLECKWGFSLWRKPG